MRTLYGTIIINIASIIDIFLDVNHVPLEILRPGL